MSGIITPGIYVAGITGALQAKLASAGSTFKPNAEIVTKYLASDTATKAIAASDVTAIHAYLATPQSAATISNAIIIANKVIQYFKTHKPGPVGTAGKAGSTSTVAASSSIPTTPEGPQQGDEETTPDMTENQAAAAALK